MKFSLWRHDMQKPHPVLSCSHPLEASLTYQQFLDNAGNNPARPAAAGTSAGAAAGAAQNGRSCHCGSARIQQTYGKYVCDICELDIPEYSCVPSCRRCDWEL